MSVRWYWRGKEKAEGHEADGPSASQAAEPGNFKTTLRVFAPVRYYVFLLFTVPNSHATGIKDPLRYCSSGLLHLYSCSDAHSFMALREDSRPRTVPYRPSCLFWSTASSTLTSLTLTLAHYLSKRRHATTKDIQPYKRGTQNHNATNASPSDFEACQSKCQTVARGMHGRDSKSDVC